MKIRKRAVLIVLVLLVAYFFPYDFVVGMLNDLLTTQQQGQCITRGLPKGILECATGSDRISSVVMRWGFIPTFGSPLANILSFQHFLALLAVSFIIFNIGARAEAETIKPEEWEWEET